MGKIERFGALVVTFLIWITSAAHASGIDRVVRVSDGTTIHFEEMIKEIKKPTLVFIGEVHDNPGHHRAQLSFIRSLHESGFPVAIGLEIFRADSQRDLDLWTRGDFVLEKFLPVFHDNSHAPWQWYRDIFLYARDNAIPLIGLNVPDAITQKVSRQGFASLSTEELRQLPPGISCDVDAEYMDFIRRAHEGHAKHDDKSFRSFCEAQMLWDKVMAWHLIEFKKKNPGKTVIVLAGVGHSWKRGIPVQVKRQSPYQSTVILPEIPFLTGRRRMTSGDADYILLQ
jgi:uncharacterized iron-regulated protein